MSPWRTPRPLALSVMAWMILAACAIRHNHVWGGEWAALFHGLEGAGVVAFAALAGCAWLAALRLADQMSPRQIWAGGAVLTLLAVAAPAFLSTDVFDYVARGRVESLHGANPYVATPADFDRVDQVMAIANWPTQVLPYGPLSALLQAAITSLCGNSVELAAWVFKSFFGACHAASAVLIGGALAHHYGRLVARRGTVGWLWNPYLLLESANSGHNDALMATFLAAMVWGIAKDRLALATVAFGAAVLTKHGCAVLGPLLLALAVYRRRFGAFALGVALTGAFTAPLAWHYYRDPGALEFLTNQATVVRASIQWLAREWLGPGAFVAVRTLGLGAVLGAIAWAVAGLRYPVSFANRGARVILVFLLLLMPQFLAWYHLWWLPLMGLWDAPALTRMFVVLTFTAPASYAVYATTRSLEVAHQVAQWTLGLALPIAAGVWPQDRVWNRGNRGRANGDDHRPAP